MNYRIGSALSKNVEEAIEDGSLLGLYIWVTGFFPHIPGLPEADVVYEKACQLKMERVKEKFDV